LFLRVKSLRIRSLRLGRCAGKRFGTLEEVNPAAVFDRGLRVQRLGVVRFCGARRLVASRVS
jgi:hypothetical protein